MKLLEYFLFRIWTKLLVIAANQNIHNVGINLTKRVFPRRIFITSTAHAALSALFGAVLAVGAGFAGRANARGIASAS